MIISNATTGPESTVVTQMAETSRSGEERKNAQLEQAQPRSQPLTQEACVDGPFWQQMEHGNRLGSRLAKWLLSIRIQLRV